MNIKLYLNDKKTEIDSFLSGYFRSMPDPPKLRESMSYSLNAGGKRIRPVLCMAAYEACGGADPGIIPFASSLEFVHTYSLIHDDLPAMDDDDLRRGKPTNHVVFGEGMAILAGDGLLTEAFAILSNPLYSEPFGAETVLSVVRELSLASGCSGMVAGQAQDLLSENAEPDSETLSFIHRRKTAAMITASVRMGALLVPASEKQIGKITEYGECIGLAFQIIDDVLDVVGETEILGKPKGSDEKKKKMTYPRLYGIGHSREKAYDLLNEAIGALAEFDERADPLREIARYLGERQS